MKLSDYVIDFLVSQKVGHVFEVCGGALAHLLDSLYEREDIQTVSLHHEQAVAFAAEGYSRVGENIGVCMATSGPGATNFITGIGSCYFDSIPCVFITGQVNTYEFKFDKSVRQVGFQETDIVSLVKPITKYAKLVQEPEKIKYYLEEAFHIARSGRPGPVLLDIPMNVQRADIDVDSLKSFSPKRDTSYKKPDERSVKEIFGLLQNALRPVVLIGGGLRLSKAQDELLKFADNTGVPVVSSLMGIDGFVHDHPSYSGMIGTYGNRYANLTVANADLLIALGTRLDTRQTGTKPETFARGAKFVHVDIDASELNNKKKANIALNFDAADFLKALNAMTVGFDKKKINKWLEKIAQYKEKYSSYNINDSNEIGPNYFLHRLSAYLPQDAVISTDVGQNQIWAAQEIEVKKGQRFLTQGGMGAMGCSLSMAIGASFLDKKRNIVSINGDGGFQLNIQELQSVYHYGLPIKIVMLNNSCYGMVRQFQQQYFNSRFQSTVVGYSCPDFQSVVAAYKIPVYKIEKASDIDSVLKKFFSMRGAGFLEVAIEADNKVLPKLSVNMPIEDQEPLLSIDELKDNMLIEVLREET